MKRLVVTRAARADLQSIAQYTEQQWGKDQKQRYFAALERRLIQIRRNPAMGTRRDEVRAGARSMLSGRHVLIYRESEDRVVLLRVLHVRMDVERHL